MLEKRGFHIILTILFAIIIFYVSSLSNLPAPKMIDLSSFYHFLIFFYFSFFLLLAIKGRDNLKLKNLILPMIIALIYAALDEIHQAFVPYRSCDFFDFFTDSAGILASTFFILLLNLKKSNNQKHN